MVSRTRSSVLTRGNGTYQKYFFGTMQSGTVPIPGVKGTCSDVVDGTYRDHPLGIDKVEYSNTSFSGTLNGGTGISWGKYVDHTPGLIQGLTYGHNVLPPLNDAADATKAFARTNPSRTVVDVPAFIGELKELPSLFQIAGKHLLKRGANAYLSYQYGWKPLISDLKGFLDFQRHVMKREAELQNLFNKGGLRRTFQLSSDVATTRTTSTIFLESSLYTLSSTEYTVETERRRWATSRWQPTVSSVPKTDAELHKLAVQAVYGLSANASSAWNLIPFTWLIDWASSVGDYFDAQRNSVGASCGGVCVMTHTKSTHRYGKVLLSTGGTWTGVKLPSPKIVVEQKLRSFSAAPSISASLPFITGTKLSILGALGIQRLRGIH